MDMTGERRIPAPREKVWEALNDPAVLKSCIPGCESLEKTSPTDMKATAAIKIGPISARFTGQVALRDLDPPNGYRIEGEGQGGVAGFAKGGATVHLVDDGAGTLLTYDVKAQVGGKIAQLGARLIDATAKQMSDAFFNRFSAVVGAASAPVTASAPVDAPVMAPGVAAPGVTTPGNAEAGTQIAAGEVGAAGPVGAMAAAVTAPASPAAISIFSLIPKAPYGYPIVFWIGSFLFVCIFVLIFKGYL